jgi:long-chain fatty acid transport protein
MKYSFKNAVLSCFIIAWSGMALAASVRNNPSGSTQHTMTSGTRSATIDAADAGLYNPAGLTAMEEGFYQHFSNSFIRDETKVHNHDTGEDYERKMAIDLYPVGSFAYRKDDWAAFFTISYPGFSGGGESDSNGIAYMDFAARIASLKTGTDVTATDKSFELGAIALALTFGGSYQNNELIFTSYGIRQVLGSAYMDGGYTLRNSSGVLSTHEVDVEQTATGIGHVFGISIIPNKKMNIGIRYETQVDMEFTSDVKIDTVFGQKDGEKSRNDIPALLSVGFSYHVNDKLRTEADFTYYFVESAKTMEDNHKDAHDLSVAAWYQLEEDITIAGGYSITERADNDSRNSMSYDLDYSMISFGGEYNASENLMLMVGYSHYLYETANGEDDFGSYTIDEEQFTLSFGFEYKM